MAAKKQWKDMTDEQKQAHYARQRAWRAKNKEKVRGWNRAQYANNREARLDYQAAYRAENGHCSKWYHSMKHRTGCSLELFEKMLVEQRGCCASCGDQMTRTQEPHVDHCHNSGKIRGLLCFHCNVALGHLRDSSERILALNDYLTERG